MPLIFFTSINRFIRSKHHPEDVEAALDDTLKELDLEYLDVCSLFLVTKLETSGLLE
jgi:diketogulonate reductase-like aldo/keto reductase